MESEMKVMDFEELREYLTQYVGTGMTTLRLSPIPMGILGMIQNADENELIEIAKELGVID